MAMLGYRNCIGWAVTKRYVNLQTVPEHWSASMFRERGERGADLANSLQKVRMSRAAPQSGTSGN